MQDIENNKDEDVVRKEGDPGNTDIKADGVDNTDENAGKSKDEGSSGKESNDATHAERRYTELNEKYLRLYSEFDNYRKRSMRERADLIRTAGEDVFKSILPVIDDLERAIRANEKIDDAKTVKEGLQHIYNKLKNSAQQKGLTPFDSIGESFNPDTMEAITHIEAEDEAQKGKVIDEVEKGYKLGDKVIRFARVVVAR
jgi:molecular chaperone GrpE